jgi:ribulose-bisphosphate carboxylase small chain
MRLTQGTFSFLPDLTNEQIRKQVDYCQSNGWAVGIEYTDDPHPRNTYWEMWGLPMFDLKDPAGVLYEIEECRKAFGNCYIRVSAFDATAGWESLRLSFIVHRPAEEPGFGLERTETEGRNVRYIVRPYATQRPMGERY